MSPPVLLIDPDDDLRESLAAALARAGQNVIPLADTMAGFAALDVEPRDINLAVVRLRQATGKPHGIAFALMMRFRDKTARIVLLVDQPDDLNIFSLSDVSVFVDIVVQKKDTTAMAAKIASVLG